MTTATRSTPSFLPQPLRNALDPGRWSPWRWSTRPRLTIALTAAVVALCALPFGSLDWEARTTIAVFGLALIAWTLTSLRDDAVALAAAAVLIALGISSVGEAAGAAVDPNLWLLMAAFVLAAGVKASGLSARLTAALCAHARTVAGLFGLLTVALSLTAFAVPATSARAALALPAFVALAGTIGDRRITRALALLFPSVVLLSAVASLLGAGAHLITIQVLQSMTGESLGFLGWMILGVPFALVSSGLACMVILRMFLTGEERRRPVTLTVESLGGGTDPLSRSERSTLAILLGAIALWSTHGLHGLHPAVVAIAAAVGVLALRTIGPRAGWSAIKWDLLVFMAATLVLGEALVASGAGQALLDTLFGFADGGGHTVLVAVLVAAISLTAHLVITSRTARATVLVPLVVILALSLGLNPTALAFLSTAAAGYCLTMVVSAKPMRIFAKVDGDTYTPSDLGRLSAVLMPLHLVLLVIFALAVWPALGLSLTSATPVARTAAGAPVLLWHERPAAGVSPAPPAASPPNRAATGSPDARGSDGAGTGPATPGAGTPGGTAPSGPGGPAGPDDTDDADPTRPTPDDDEADGPTPDASDDDTPARRESGDEDDDDRVAPAPRRAAPPPRRAAPPPRRAAPAPRPAPAPPAPAPAPPPAPSDDDADDGDSDD